MTVFLVVFFFYIVLRIFFRERQKKAGDVYMVGSRFAVLPEHVRAISIVGMSGIALLIVILTIMGYQLTADQIASMLTLGIIMMSVQYLPLCIVGENGLVSIDTQVNWKDVVAARVQSTKKGSSVQIIIDFKSPQRTDSIHVFIHSSQVKEFEKIVRELTSVSLNT